MRRLSLLGAFLTILLFLVFASCTEENLVAPFTKDLQETKANANVPFKGTYTTLVTVNVPPCLDEFSPPFGTLTITANGKATHLGKSTWDAPVVFNGIPDDDGIFTQSGSMTFTAANGDQLIGFFDGFARNIIPPEDVFVEGWGHFIITEGTGRFEGATLGVGDGIWDDFDGTYNFQAGTPDFTNCPIQGQGHIEFLGTLINP